MTKLYDQTYYVKNIDQEMEKTPSFECNVKGKLEAILAEQISRLLSCGSIKPEVVNDITKDLRDQNLLPEQIESSLCTELKLICTKRYDTIMQDSDRLNGFGWSDAHIKVHMQRLLKTKLSEVASVLRAKL